MSIVHTKVSANNEGGIATVSVGLTHKADGLSDVVTKEAIAVKSRKDKGDPAIGERLALGRALVKAGNALIGQAEGLDKHREDMREYRKRQKARRRNSHVPGDEVAWDNLKVGDHFYYVKSGAFSTSTELNTVYRVDKVIEKKDGSRAFSLSFNTNYTSGVMHNQHYSPGPLTADYVVIADPKDF